jgi:hypothetical protein
MTKNQELAFLRATADKLGSDSYLGPWLRQILPELEAIIRSDNLPQITIADAITQAEQAARIAGEQIIREAEREAEQIRRQAQNCVETGRAILATIGTVIKRQEDAIADQRRVHALLESRVRA